MPETCDEWIGGDPHGAPERTCRRAARIRLTLWPGQPREIVCHYCTQHARAEYATRGDLPMRWQTLASIANAPSPTPETET